MTDTELLNTLQQRLNSGAIRVELLFHMHNSASIRICRGHGQDREGFERVIKKPEVSHG